MIHLAIVDDHEIVRAGFREMLAEELDLTLAFEAASGEEALERLRETPCELILLDLSLPGLSGVDVLRAVHSRHEAVAMLRHGADGYLCKDCDREELLRAIRTVAQGRRYVSPRTAELLADELTGAAPEQPHEQLSERELQVFLRLAAGESVSDIAAALNLSIKTVSTYRSRLLEKLDLASNAELATYAVRHGLLGD
jgi:two-component system invasion response regulator UvrY